MGKIICHIIKKYIVLIDVMSFKMQSKLFDYELPGSATDLGVDVSAVGRGS